MTVSRSARHSRTPAAMASTAIAAVLLWNASIYLDSSALTAGTVLGEHESPGEATLLVLEGHVTLRAGEEEWEARGGDHVVIPPERHDLAAITDAAVLLTVATRAND